MHIIESEMIESLSNESIDDIQHSNSHHYVCMYREGAGLYQPRRHRPPTGPYAIPKRFSVVAEFYIEML